MTNFRIEWATSPWLMFLLIPALALTLWPYFRVSKRYRRNRNRICSIVFHMIIMVLSISVLAGMYFTFDMNNSKNEMILLVDVSYSSDMDEASKAEKDTFIRDILFANNERYKVGIVTFGYTQNYVAELSYDAYAVFDQYMDGKLPDVTATDIASALTFVWDAQMHSGLFNYPDYGKIVLISDGLQTDGEALAVVKNIAKDGIKIDTVCFSSSEQSDVQVIGLNTPDQNIVVNQQLEMQVTLQSSVTGNATLTFIDEYTDARGDEQTIETPMDFELIRGVQTIPVQHTFLSSGLHRLYVEFESQDDTLSLNNEFYSYFELYVHDKILIVERYEDESLDLRKIISREEEYLEDSIFDAEDLFDVTTYNIFDENLPRTVNELRDYDQVILVNISEADMQEVNGFEDSLFLYVRDYGGGLLTVGGAERDENNDIVMDPNGGGKIPMAHSYVEKDMKGSKYQSLLPVNITSYTPPIAVMILIDASGSMAEKTNFQEKSRLELAQQGALSCLNALSDRDYCGIGSFNDQYTHLLNPTPVTQKSKIRNAINSIPSSDSGTSFSSGINRALQLLSTVQNVEKRHIIIITDGAPGDSAAQTAQYLANLRSYYNTYGITCSVGGIDIMGSDNPTGVIEVMNTLVNAGHGNFFYPEDPSEFAGKCVEELQQTTMEGIMVETIAPRISNITSAVAGLNENDLASTYVYGYFVSKAKTTSNVSVALMAGSVPLYAQWDYGKGRVGSYMSDLSEDNWGIQVVSSITGMTFVHNVVTGLMPSEDIRAKDIDVVFVEDNYSTRASIYTGMNDGDTLEVLVKSMGATDAEAQVATQTSANRFTFKIFEAGIHSVTIIKRDAEGNEISRLETYKSFSYSKEYNVFREAEEGAALLAQLASDGNGNFVERANDVFGNENLHQVFDPRLAFIITALVLFLLDVAVRKFKFKWPHEIVREHKEKKALRRK